MAIELNNRTKILAGVVALAAIGAGAWFFFLEEFLSEPPPKPVAVKSAPAKGAPAEAQKQGAAKPAADAPKQAASPAAKPIPENPDRLTAEVMQNSGIRTQFLPFAREVVLQADLGGEPSGPSDVRAVAEIMERVYEPGKMNDELTANLKAKLDVERMGRFLELLRRPIALKMSSEDTHAVPHEAVRESQEQSRKNPPSAARVKLIQSIDDATRTTEVALEISSTIGRSMVDTMLAELRKMGKNVPKEAQAMVASQLNAMRAQARAQVRSVLFAKYRNASDEELAEFVKLIDTDTGRWGYEVLANSVRPVMSSRGAALGAEAGRLAMARRSSSAAKTPAAPEPVARTEDRQSAEKPEKRAAAAPAAPAQAPGYSRPANIREAYTRYNDVVTATVMRDRAAVKELLDDGKNPNARQSDGFTPLMIAVSNGDADIASMLLAKGADPNLRSQGGATALSIARSRGSAGAGVAQMLVRSGAKE